MVRPNIVDFHCHLDLLKDMTSAFARCDEIACTTLTMTTTPKAFKRNFEFANRTKNVNAALGLHPQLVSKRGHEIDLFEELAEQTRFIGEIGLDAGRAHYSSFEAQKLVFERALRVCARQGKKIISIHSVRCARQVLDFLEATGADKLNRVVLHWFSASEKDYRRAIDMGCWFSVNQQMLSSKPGQLLSRIAPQNRILTETDAPFIEVNGKPIQPGEVIPAAKILAGAWGIELDDALKRIQTNADEILAP